VEIAHLQNPRTEKEEHYYNVKHTKLLDLGLKPHLLNDEVVTSMLKKCLEHRESVVPDVIKPSVRWHGGAGAAVSDEVHTEGAFTH
jgi:UDP-sulfoquinovose synthase